MRRSLRAISLTFMYGCVLCLFLVPWTQFGCDNDRFQRVTTRAIISWDGSKYNLGWDLSTPKGVAMEDNQSGVILLENVVQIAVAKEFVGGLAQPNGQATWFMLQPSSAGSPSLRGESYQLTELPNKQAWQDAWNTLGLTATLGKPKI